MCDNGNLPISLTNISERLCRRITDDGKSIEDITEEFSALKSNSARVDYAYEKLNNYGLFPKLSNNSSKNEKVAIDLRKEGNLLFHERNDRMALFKYTQSIAHSPKTSENLGLCYANRSAVLFDHKLYKECLKDVSYALSNNYPKHLREKILRRRDKAEFYETFQIVPSYHLELPNISFDANMFIECAGDCVKINIENSMGRHVIASKHIQVGEVIAIEKPFSKILIADCFLTHCYNCLMPTYNLIPCENCTSVLFCGEECKLTSWNHCHKYECPILDTLLNLGANKLTLLAMKICLSVGGHNVLAHHEGSIYKSENYQEIHNLVANTGVRTQADLFGRATISAIIVQLVQQETEFLKEGGNKTDVFKELLLLHMQTGPSNFHEISELVKINENPYVVAEVGAGAYAFLSLLNHSCCPNVVRHCYKEAIVLRALRPIAIGEQLFDNYGYHHAVMPRTERQRCLKKQYHFQCKCEACTGNWPLYHELVVNNYEIPITEEQITNLRNGNIEFDTETLLNLQNIAGNLEQVKPSKELADVQEIIKQYYAIFANNRVTF